MFFLLLVVVLFTVLLRGGCGEGGFRCDCDGVLLVILYPMALW